MDPLVVVALVLTAVYLIHTDKEDYLFYLFVAVFVFGFGSSDKEDEKPKAPKVEEARSDEESKKIAQPDKEPEKTPEKNLSEKESDWDKSRSDWN